MLYTARKYISDRCYTIMSTLLVTQYCHVHFHGGGVVVLESTCSTPRNPLYTTEEFFKADLSTNTTHLHDCITLLYLSRLFFFFKFSNPSKIKIPDLYKKAKP